MTNNEMEKLIADVSFVVHDLTRKAFTKIDEYLKEYGLVRTHATILKLLKLNKMLPMGELGEKLQVTKQNITGLIDKLEKLGYVERVSAPNDRRIILIKLSDSGDKFVDMYVKRLYEFFSSTFSKLSSEDLAVFNGNILSLKELLSKLEEE
ncbi:MarR family winged helix-turn-helix transcriptional regulator [Clostridium saccharoperbutylacetonicum]|uniref:MarR family winged helix-turn-helix transcriptional regulator n=1 Tax=Clostridium saccharoperbutylacetonicum TaxID=36745 RepID=UPI0039EA78CC